MKRKYILAIIFTHKTEIVIFLLSPVTVQKKKVMLQPKTL